jgi:O-antigen ligase
VHILIVILIAAGMLLTQALMGGFSLLFAIPGYALIALAAILVLFQSTRRIHPGVNVLSVFSTVALVGYVAWRSRTSPVEYLARADFYMALAALAVYLLTACYLRTVRQRLWLVYAMFGVSLLHVAAGVLQFAKNDQFMLLSLLPDGMILPKIFRPENGWRASGFYGCPNHLAGFLETLGSVALGLCFLGRGRSVARMLFIYFVLSCMAGIAITGSRGGYVSTLVGIAAFAAIGLWVVKKLRPERLWIAFLGIGILSAIVVGAAIVAMSSSASIKQRMDNIAEVQNMRRFMWAAALKQYQLSPIIGTGSGTYLYYGRQLRSAEVQADPMHVHNDYLELLGEYGAAGAALFLAFWVLHLRSGWQGLSAIVRRRLRPANRIMSDELGLVAGTLAAVVALTVHSVLDFNCHIPGNTLFFAFLFGILASPTSDPKITSEVAPRAIRPVRLALPALGGIILVMGIPLLPAEYHAEWARVQLRNKLFVDVLSDVQKDLALTAAAINPGLPMPAVVLGPDWEPGYFTSHLVAEAQRHAQEGLATEDANPNLHYYLGEVRHFQAVYGPLVGPEGAISRQQELQLHNKAREAYETGLALFPQDARLQQKLARALDNLGRFDLSEAVYLKALDADPNLAEIYAQYGLHLWLRRELVRAEAYYRRALSFKVGNDLAEAGLEDIAQIRALAKNQHYVEQNGDPLENYNLDPPTPEDEKRGVTWHE